MTPAPLSLFSQETHPQPGGQKQSLGPSAPRLSQQGRLSYSWSQRAVEIHNGEQPASIPSAFLLSDFRFPNPLSLPLQNTNRHHSEKEVRTELIPPPSTTTLCLVISCIKNQNKTGLASENAINPLICLRDWVMWPEYCPTQARRDRRTVTFESIGLAVSSQVVELELIEQQHLCLLRSLQLNTGVGASYSLHSECNCFSPVRTLTGPSVTPRMGNLTRREFPKRIQNA